jgi:hypothetical protein
MRPWEEVFLGEEVAMDWCGSSQTLTCQAVTWRVSEGVSGSAHRDCGPRMCISITCSQEMLQNHTLGNQWSGGRV